jgi:hypothetical protein
MGRMIRQLPPTRALNKQARGGGGLLRLQANKPVVLGSGWGAHSLMAAQPRAHPL